MAQLSSLVSMPEQGRYQANILHVFRDGEYDVENAREARAGTPRSTPRDVRSGDTGGYSVLPRDTRQSRGIALESCAVRPPDTR